VLVANLKASPQVPWAVPVMAIILWVMWRYAGGAWLPLSTQQTRAHYRRAEPVPASVLRLGMLVGVLGVGALVVLWVLLGHLVHVPGNPSARYGSYPVVTVACVIVMASVVGAVAEEVGFRGYMLSRLERALPGWVAVIVAALVIAPAHGVTQGFAAVTFGWYLLADLLFGSLALVTRSILPGTAVHALGLMAFFAVVWPSDHLRHAAPLGQQGWDFWVELGLCVMLTGGAIASFLRLVASARRAGPLPTGREM